MKSKFLAAALILACTLGTAVQSEAAEQFISGQKLKKHGIDISKVHIDRISHDGNFIIMHQKNTPEKMKEGLGYVCFAVHINDINNSIESVKSYEVPVSSWEFVMDTKDEKELIIVSKGGAVFTKLDFETGKTSILHQHIQGEPGFRGFPPILQMVDDEIFIRGYFHNGEDLSDVDCTATLDPSKQNVEAFDRVYDYQGMVVKLNPFAEAFSRKDMAFFCTYYEDENKADMYLWNPPAVKEPKHFDSGKMVECMWASKDRCIYSIERNDSTFDLIVYDGAKQEKIVLDEGNKNKYANVFLSADGNTALFTDIANRIHQAKYFYADAETGWKITPVLDFYNKPRIFGEIRISDDGRKFAVKSTKGLTIANIK